MSELILTSVKAYTVHSSDGDNTSSDKGVYKDYNMALQKCAGAGWFGSNGVAREMEDVYQDKTGELYIVKSIGKFTDETEKFREETLASIKSKLTAVELELLGIK